MLHKKPNHTFIRNSVIQSIVLLSTGFLVNVAHASSMDSEELAQGIWQTAISNFYNGNPQGCYKNLEKLGPALTGEITYDRMLGLCAQGAEKFDQALLAYNRILSQQPQNAEIRLERARVLYNLELYTESRKEFNWLLSKNPPSTARVVIDKYMDALNRKLPNFKRTTGLKISTSLGYDDNVNSASELDDFLGFVLSQNSKAQSSDYAGVQVGLTHARPLSHISRLKISTSIGAKKYPDAKFVDQNLLTAGAGYERLHKNGSAGFDIFTYEQQVDGDFNSKAHLFRAYYLHHINKKISIMPYLQAAAFRFKLDIATKDINQYIYGARLDYRLNNTANSTIGIDYSFTHDYPLFVDSNYEVDIYTLKLDLKHNFSDSLSSKSLLQYSVFNYDKPFFKLAFPGPRDDELLNFSSSLNWNLRKNIQLTPLVGYRDYSSNVGVFAYQRWYAELGLAYKREW